MSTNTGMALWWSTAPALAQKVKAGTITSSPGPTPSPATHRCSAAVPLLTGIQCFTPVYSAHSLASPSDWIRCWSVIRGVLIHEATLRQ